MFFFLLWTPNFVSILLSSNVAPFSKGCSFRLVVVFIVLPRTFIALFLWFFCWVSVFLSLQELSLDAIGSIMPARMICYGYGMCQMAMAATAQPPLFFFLCRGNWAVVGDEKVASIRDISSKTQSIWWVVGITTITLLMETNWKNMVSWNNS